MYCFVLFQQYMLGKKIAKKTVKIISYKTGDVQYKDTSDVCCSCEKRSDSGLENPSPLLQSEYLGNGKNNSAAQLLTFETNNHQNESLTSELV